MCGSFLSISVLTEVDFILEIFRGLMKEINTTLRKLRNLKEVQFLFLIKDFAYWLEFFCFQIGRASCRERV